MDKDPCMFWEGEFPYDILEPAGITPYSSIRDVIDSMGYFIQHGMPSGVHQAWSKLGTIKDRLFIDFFLYRRESLTSMKEEQND